MTIISIGYRGRRCSPPFFSAKVVFLNNDIWFERGKDTMAKNYRELGKQAEDAVRGIKDKELRREAFRILLLQFMAEGRVDNGKHYKRNGQGKLASNAKQGFGKPKPIVKGKPAVVRPGRRGGGIATVAIQKLIDGGSFKIGRDAAGVMNELNKKRVKLEPSQLRMVLLRFARTGKLKRRIKMKGKKVTYLYSVK
jgi:hypothetical protein